MSSKAILLFLLINISQNFSWAQVSCDSSLIKLQKETSNFAKLAIEQQAFPGCVVYASLRGQTILSEAYGYHTYDSLISTTISDLFDLASITKVAASTLAIMKLYEQGYFELDDPIGDYLKHLGHKGLKKVTFREVLSHQAGLKSWIKFYEDLINRDGSLKKKYLTEDSLQSVYSISDHLYFNQDYLQKIRKRIIRTPLTKNPSFMYSDLFFYLIPELVKNLSSMTFEAYLNANFYVPMNAKTLVFNPLNSFPLSQIVPTEVDTFFRNTLIHGKVHDEGAILMKGISGHAGLFGNVDDLSKIWLMLMQDGVYQNQRYLKAETIRLFTTAQYVNTGNRRALGFDKPLLVYDSLKSSIAKQASPSSYGHTGFTGCLVWADPENDLLFIFLSNRVYPNRENKMIYELNIRPNLHDALYKFLKNENERRESIINSTRTICNDSK